MDNGPRPLRGDVWAIISALTTGGGLTVATIALRSMPTLTFQSYVFFFGSVIILIDALVTGTTAETLKVPPRLLGFYLLLAVLFCGSTFCLFSALAYTGPATVSFLSRLELVTTLLLARLFLKEKMRPAEYSGLIIVVAGIIVMRYGASLELSRAVALLSASALLTGTAEVMTKARIGRIRPRSFIFYRGIFMTAIFVGVGLVIGQFRWVSDLRLLSLLLLVGFFMPYLGRLGYLKAMQYIDISRASIIVQSQPFFAAIVALVVLGTFPSLKELTGGLLIVGGVLVIKLLEMKTASRDRMPLK